MIIQNKKALAASLGGLARIKNMEILGQRKGEDLAV